MAKKKTVQKKLAAPAHEIAALAEEMKGEFSAPGDGRSLLPRLNSLPAPFREELFLFFIKKNPELFSSVMEALIGREEQINLEIAKTLGHWLSPQAGVLLHRLASQTRSKDVLKAVRKSIFLLKGQGLDVEEIGQSSPVYHPPQPASPEGFLSSIDFSGKRFIWLAKPQPPQGILGIHTLIGDLEGIVEFDALEMTRREFDEYRKGFQEKYLVETVEADPAYCRGLIAEAAITNQRAGKDLPVQYVKWQSRLGPAPALSLRPLIYQYLAEEDLKSRSDLLDQSAALFSDPLFEGWIMDEEELRKYLRLLNEAASSRLVLSPYQQEARLEEIYQRAVQELFDKPRRLLYRRRLEEVSYILWKKARENQAKLSLAAAIALEGEFNILKPHPFILELVKRSMQFFQESEKKAQEGKGGMVIQP